MSNLTEIFHRDVRLNRFIFKRNLWGIYDFVENEGLKSQLLAHIVSSNPIEKVYYFFEN